MQSVDASSVHLRAKSSQSFGIFGSAFPLIGETFWETITRAEAITDGKKQHAPGWDGTATQHRWRAGREKGARQEPDRARLSHRAISAGAIQNRALGGWRLVGPFEPLGAPFAICQAAGRRAWS